MPLAQRELLVRDLVEESLEGHTWGAIRVSEAILLISGSSPPQKSQFFANVQHLRLATGHPCKHGVNMGTLTSTKLIENKFSETCDVTRRLRNEKIHRVSS